MQDSRLKRQRKSSQSWPNRERALTYREVVKAAISGKEKNARAVSWVRKAGGIEKVTEEMACRIVKICRLKAPGKKKEA